MRDCWKAKDGMVFDSKKECQEYEKGEMAKEKKRRQILRMMMDTKCPVQGYDYYKLEEWVVENYDEIQKIMNGKSIRYDDWERE
jgi:hypothetical protein